MSNVTTLFGRRPRERDWTNEELAELYRVENALVQANIPVATERGVTDEGDPWFVFCRQDGNVLVHIARYDGNYHLFSPALHQPLSGHSFTAITKSFVSAVPLSAQAAAGSRIAIHPAALLSLLVGAIFFSFDELTGHTGSAAAAEPTDGSPVQIVLPVPPTTEALRAAVVRNFTLGLSSEPSVEAERTQESFWLAIQLAAVTTVSSVVSDNKAQASDALLGDLASLALPSNGELSHQDGQPFAVSPLAHAHTNAGDASQQDSPSSIIPAATTALLAQASEVTAAPSEPPPPGLATADDGSSIDTGVAKQARQDATAMATATASHGIQSNTSDALASDGLDSASKVTIVLQGGEHVNNLTLGNIETFDVIVAAGGGSLDLAAVAHPQTIVLSGDGDVQITGLASRLAPEIVVNNGSKLALSLTYAGDPGADTGGGKAIAQTLVLDGGDVQVQSVSQADTTLSPLDLTVMSGGDRANTISLSDKFVTSTPVDITVLGAQDLTLNESVSALAQAKLDASGLTGHLSVGVVLGSNQSVNGLLTLGGSNFVVGSDASIALVNLESQAHIQLGLNLQKVLLQMNADVAPAFASLALDLHSASASPTPVNIGLIGAMGVEALTLNSLTAGTDGVNRISVIDAPNASQVVLSGDAALSIGTFAGIGADQSQNITIDAGHLSGALSMDLSGITNNETSIRQITFIGGAGNDVISVGADANVILTSGSGNNTFQLATGGTKYVVTDLKLTDKMIVGDGATADAFVNGANTTAAQQAVIDGQGGLLAAASMAGADAGIAAAHQAVLFSYGGDFYVFIDAQGNHLFDAANDAIIKLTGQPKDYAGVFYSH